MMLKMTATEGPELCFSISIAMLVANAWCHCFPRVYVSDSSAVYWTTFCNANK